MAKKSSRRKGGGGGADASGNSVDGDVDYLSESHTVATLGSAFESSMDNDDDGWGIDDDIQPGSDQSAENAVIAAEIRHKKLVEVLGTVSDFQGEKRTVKREQLLRQWFRALTQYATINYDPIEARRDDLIQACQYGLRIGSPSEQYAACRVFEAMAVLIGDESFYEEIYESLHKIVQSSHRAVPVRVAALRALGMAVFIGVDDDQVTEHILDLCEALAQSEYRGDKVPSTLRATALDVWNLLATTIHELYVAGKDDVSTGRGLLLLPLLLECLEQSEDLSLRSAAGECVAWIHTARIQLGALQTTAEGVELRNTTERQYREGTWEGSEWEDIMAEIEQVMDELSNQSGHYMSKKAKKEQRAHFREYVATIQDNEAPDHVVQFRGGSLELTSWKEIIALNFVRRCLQGGFQIQLLTNPTLQAIFGANGQALNTHGSYSSLEKRLMLSKTSEASKAKDVDLTKKRRTRTNVKNHFLTADGEDL